jgi:hypothetical protein
MRKVVIATTEKPFKPTMAMQQMDSRFKYTNPKEKDQGMCKVIWITVKMNGLKKVLYHCCLFTVKNTDLTV